MLSDADRVPLRARTWIGDTVSGATVAADGTIDWYCPGRLDRPAALGRLLDPSAGAVRVGPLRTASDDWRRLPPATTQTYLDGTLISRTVSEGPGFATELTDLMPWSGVGVTPPGRIVRVVRALAGPVDIEVEVVPGDRFGPAPARRLAAWSEGLVAGPLVVRAGMPLHPVALDRDRAVWRGTRRLEAGEVMVVTIDGVDQNVEALSPDGAARLIDDTAAAWRYWLGGRTQAGGYEDAVTRSALVLRSLTWDPGGGPAAAGTAGLPRRPGGERNADGRVVPLRLAAGAASTLAHIGLAEEAEAAEAWLRRVIEEADRPWPARVDLEGGPLGEPTELAVAGWRHSQPVRTAGAPGGVDLDVAGDVVTAISASGDPGPLTGAWPALAAGGDAVADAWEGPDTGIWGLGGPPRRLVASRIQAWVALDGLARRAWATNPLDLQAAAWHQAAGRILTWCEREGLAADGGLKLAAGAEDHPDAALLRAAWSGPWPTAHPIVVRTVDRVLEQLSTGAWIHRYPTAIDDGVAGADSPDTEASLWAVRALARLGRWDEAHERMETVLGAAGPGGLLSTAFDPGIDQLLGNLPSAAAHLAVIDAARALSFGPS